MSDSIEPFDQLPKRTRCFLMIASFPDSILQFRGALIEELQRSGFTVHIAAPDVASNAGQLACLVDRGVIFHEVSLNRSGMRFLEDLRLLRELRSLMRVVQPDFVLSYTIKPVIYGSFAAWRANVPSRFALITGLGYAFIGRRHDMLTKLVRGLYRIALKTVHKVIVQNADDATLLQEDGLVAAQVPVAIVNGSGIDTDWFSVVPQPPGPVRFLLIARLLGNKGVREYVKAANCVKARYPNVVFRLAGWIDPNPDSIGQDELDEWIVGGGIEFLGRLDDVRPAIEDCSVYVLPSYREGTPRTVLEAMAMGRAIITTDAPGCRDTVIAGENGFLVPVQSVHELAEAMCRFIEDSSLAGEMGARSREIAEEKYDVRKVNAVMLREMGIPSA